jgi:hypothetical protein
MTETKTTLLLVTTGIAAMGSLLGLIPQFMISSELAHLRAESQTEGKIVERITAQLADLTNEHWEYKVVSVMAEGHDRTGEGSMRYASVKPGEKELGKLGGEGWELVSSYLEMETSYPNFGKEAYVTGIQPNVRPQRAVLLFRRRVARGG